MQVPNLSGVKNYCAPVLYSGSVHRTYLYCSTYSPCRVQYCRLFTNTFERDRQKESGSPQGPKYSYSTYVQGRGTKSSSRPIKIFPHTSSLFVRRELGFGTHIKRNLSRIHHHQFHPSVHPPIVISLQHSIYSNNRTTPLYARYSLACLPFASIVGSAGLQSFACLSFRWRVKNLQDRRRPHIRQYAKFGQ